MLLGLLLRTRTLTRCNVRHLHTPVPIDKIRNIGIVAHIDAGKTTVTEQILVETGYIKHAGKIKDGSTTTDYLECEQNRGITVSSAFVQTSWKDHVLKIIDTPGHIDFNIEVERAVRVLDGSIVVLDGTRGVEAQTVTVWQQLQKFDVPRLIFLNKFDRALRNLDVCLESIRRMLNIEPVLLNYPEYNQDNVLVGVTDICSSTRSELKTELIESLASLDETLEQEYLVNEFNAELISSSQIRESMTRLHRSGRIVPVCVGSGHAGIGISCCLDYIMELLPSPAWAQSKLPEGLRNDLCGVIFKSTFDNNRGVLCQARLYSGVLKPGHRVYNARTKTIGVVSNLYQSDAGMFIPKQESSVGDIIVFSGCKEFRTGDIFVNERWSLDHVGLEEHINQVEMLKSTISYTEPLFFCTVETETVPEQKRLETALKRMYFEDPTLKVKKGKNEEILLGGNGQLHLMIVHERLKQEHNVDCKLYKFRVAYKETLTEPIQYTYEDKSFRMSFEIQPSSIFRTIHVKVPDGNFETKRAIEYSIMSCLAIGPRLGLQLINTAVHANISEKHGSTGTLNLREVTKCVKNAMKQALQENISSVSLSEPFADVEVIGPHGHSGDIISDFNGRIGSSDYEVTYSDDEFRFVGKAPLSKLADYASQVRSISRGAVVLKNIEVDKYYPMDPTENEALIKEFKSGNLWL